MQFSLRYIQVFDDINRSNIKELREFYDSADLRLTAKFELPNFNESNLYMESIKNMKDFSVDNISRHLINYAYLTKNVADAIAKDLITELKILLPSDNAIKSAYGKIAYWIKSIFNGVLNDRTSTIYIDAPLDKYEIYMVYIASKLSNNIVIVDRKLDKSKYKHYNNIQYNTYNDKENISIDDIQTEKVELTKDSICERLSGQKYLAGEKILVIGVSDQNSIYNKLVEIDENTPDNIMILRLGVGKASADELSKLPKPSAQSIEQLEKLVGTHMFAKHTVADKAVAFIKREIHKESNVTIAISRLMSFMCLYNRYKLDASTVIIFGNMHKSTKPYMDFLAYIGKQVIVIDFTGESISRVDESWNVFKNGESITDRDVKYPQKIKANTVAYKAEREIDTLLYNGETPGLYRNNQFSKCDVTGLKTTFDEMKILWGVENTARPFFSNTDTVVKIPTLYAKILGVCDNYENELGAFVAEHTLICMNSVDIQNLLLGNVSVRDYTLYSNNHRVAIRLADKNELNTQNIMNCELYPYRHLSVKVQDTILTGLKQLVKDMTAGQVKNISKIIDAIVEVGLNLSPSIYQEMQWHDFTKHNPKLVVMLQQDTFMDIRVEILIKLLHLCGWDIAVIIPTGYNLISDKDMQEHQIGEFKFDCNLNKLEKTAKQKESIFSRLFR